MIYEYAQTARRYPPTLHTNKKGHLPNGGGAKSLPPRDPDLFSSVGRFECRPSIPDKETLP